MITAFHSGQQGLDLSGLVADVANTLARWGYRVLCVDWDLDEGRLSRRFGTVAKVGVVDLVLDAGRDGVPGRYLMSVDDADGTVLDLLPNRGYASTQEEIDWDTLYRTRRLGDFLEAVTEGWRASYDAVLIDAPDGADITTAISVAQLPDALVVLVLPGDDRAVDLVAQAESARDGLPYDRPRLLTLPCRTGPGELGPRLTGALDDWADASVPVQRMIDVLSLGGPLDVLAALLASELRDTGLLISQESTVDYIAQAAAGPPGRVDRLDLVRHAATDALTKILTTILPAAEWVAIERSVLDLSRALDNSDADAMTRSVTDLAAAGVRSGGRDLTPPPHDLRARIDVLLGRLEQRP